MPTEPSALDELCDALAIRAVLARRMGKQAAGFNLGEMAQHLVSGDSPGYMTARNALIGAGAGGLAGAMGIGSDRSKDRSALADAGRMALLGGAIGGGGTAAYQYWPLGETPSASADRITDEHSMDVGPGGNHPLPVTSVAGDLANRITATGAAVHQGDYGNAAKQVLPVLGSKNPLPHIGVMAGGAAAGAGAGLGLQALRRRAALPGQIARMGGTGGKAISEFTQNPDFAKRLMASPQSGLPGRSLFPGLVQNAQEGQLLKNLVSEAKKQNPMRWSRWGLGAAGGLGAGFLGDQIYRGIAKPDWAE